MYLLCWKIKSQKQLLLFFTRHCFPLVFHNKKHLTIAWQVLWWSQSSFHLIITHMTCLCVGKFSTSLPAFGPWTMNGYALYFDENYSCLTLERAVVCWQKQLNFVHRRCSCRRGWIFWFFYWKKMKKYNSTKF